MQLSATGTPTRAPAEDSALLGGSSSSASAPTNKKLSLLGLSAILFFNVSGGPQGSEYVVAYAGPYVGIFSTLVFALLFAVPQAMYTTELSTAFPVNAGYTAWVQAAFGDFWGLQEGLWSLVSGIVDTATYPILVYDAVDQMMREGGFSSHAGGAHATPWARPRCTESIDDEDAQSDLSRPLGLWSCLEINCGMEYSTKLFLLLLFTIPNLFNVHSVGWVAVALAVLVLVPFVLLVLGSLPHMHPEFLTLPALPHNSPQRGFTEFINILFWNLSGFAMASTLAGEVDRPSVVYPRAMTLTVLMMLVAYCVPYAVGAMVDQDWRCWSDGSFVYVAELVGGPWLAWAMLASTLISNWGMYTSEVLEDSFQLLGMAEVGLAPSIFLVRAKSGAPIVAIAVITVLVALLVSMSFAEILAVNNFFFAAAAALEALAFIRLRTEQPELPRPWSIPLSNRAASVFVAPQLLICAVVCVLALAKSALTACLCMGVLVLCLGVGVAHRHWLRRMGMRPAQQAAFAGGTPAPK